jgi:hypothetical protein
MPDFALTKIGTAAGYPLETKSVSFVQVDNVTKPNNSITYSSGDVFSSNTFYIESPVTSSVTISSGFNAFSTNSCQVNNTFFVLIPEQSIWLIADSIQDPLDPMVFTFNNLAPKQSHIIIDTVEMYCNSVAVPSGASPFRIHLYSEYPTPVNDNAAYTLASGDRTSYQGYISVTGFQDLGDTIFTNATGLQHHVVMSSGETNVYGILQILGDCPSAPEKVITITLKGSQL